MYTCNKNLSCSLRLRLLIIDKNEMNCAKLMALHDSYEVLYADNVNTGLGMAREHTPSLLIINTLLPENDIRVQLKKTLRTSRIPVLAIINRDEMHTLPQSVLAGCDDFIQSSFEEAELLLRVGIMLAHKLQLHERYVNFVVEGNMETSRDLFLKRIKIIIEKNLNNNLFGVSDLAYMAGVSQPQLYRKLIALTGFSPNTYIRHIRLKHAARLLALGAGNVGEIAFRVGFNSHSYFAKCFKAAHRYNPKQMMG